MKNYLSALLLLFVYQLSAQQETLFDEFDIRGAFGGPILEIGSINGEIGADVGGGGALIINNFFFGGYGMGTDYPELEINNLDYNLRFKHGGFWLGYASREYKLLHLYSSVKIGWGKAQLRREGESDFTERHFTMTPELGVELNLTDWFKLGFTGGYRWVNGINLLPGLSNTDFSSPVGVLTFRFGGFDSNNWDWDD
ncbi:MAG: hypothetical protein IPJ74_17015 [Saprospiraceae bacterium]|nr:hypothetical protein [Saprospiraceae bacterium]